MGLKTGDIVLLHSSLGSIGRVEGGPDTVIDAFLETLGPEGTLAVPVFAELGIIPHTLRNRAEAVVSDCPYGTIAAIGADAEFICRDHWKADTVHGRNTPYLKIADLSGYVCLLGVDQDRNTSLHSVEALLELPYLGTATAKVETGSGTVEKTWKYYPGPHRDFIGLDHILRESGKMNIGCIGSAVVRLIKSVDLIATLTEFGKKHPDFALCRNLNCADCVRQRAALRKVGLARENFKLAVAASVAGRYIPEMLENMRAAGIEYIELDFIQGKPAYLFPAEQLREAVKKFSANGIKVSALRLSAVPADFGAVIDLLQTAGIGSLIMPLTADAGEFVCTAAAAGIEITFCNRGISGTYTANILSRLAGEGIKAGFAFSPADFAAAGEKPFLETFQQGKFRKYITQLDIEDALFDGTPTACASGNAEIRELVSILRCASFSGFMTISGNNRDLGSVRELAEKFYLCYDMIASL
ncbi:MAG: AAC(3) family N-acetyltransferase [Victivallales bacterium]|nr:AAC(3) family N-acetyltransferase [Victivallales bacterium]